MHQDERDFIRQSARRIEEWENTPRPFEDPYADMTTDDKSKALLAKDEALRESWRQNAELVARLDSLTECLEQSNQRLDESNRHSMELTMTLNGVIDSLKSQLEEANAMLRKLAEENAALKERALLADKERFGSRSRKGTSRAKNTPERSRKQDKDDFDGTPGSIASTDSTEPQESPARKGRTTAQLTAGSAASWTP